MERGYAPLDEKILPATAEKACGPSAAISPRREVGLGGHNLAELRSIADWLIHNISLGKKTCPTAIDHRLAASRKQYLIYSPNLARFHFSSITDVSHCPPDPEETYLLTPKASTTKSTKRNWPKSLAEIPRPHERGI